MVTEDEIQQVKLHIKKYKKLMGQRKALTKIQGNGLYLIRSDSTVEFYENVPSGEFEYTHTNGSAMKAFLSPPYLKSFTYGDDYFKAYILDENSFLPYSGDPVLDAEHLNQYITKIQSDESNWKAQQEVARGKKWKQILWGIAILFAIVFGMLILTNMLAPDLFANIFGGGTPPAPLTPVPEAPPIIQKI